MEIKHIFRELSDLDLLAKCLHGCTENPNESFNDCIGVRLLKTVFVGLNAIKVGVLDSVICFNDGSIKRLQVLEKLGIIPGFNTTIAMEAIDKERLRDADKYTEYIANEVRVRSRSLKRKKQGMESEKDYAYGAGRF